MSQFYPLKVIEKKQLTPESVSLSLAIPGELKKIFDFKPGQFVMVQKEIDGQKLRRYYSIYNLPGEGKLQLGIKVKGEDGFANYAMHHIQPGEVLEVSAPMDDVNFDTETQKPQKLLAITIGSGITPFYSYIQHMLKTQPNTELVLVYGNENPVKTMFYKELHTLAKTYPQQLKIYDAFSQSAEGDFQERINPKVLKEILAKEGAGFDAVYIIGPDDLKKMAAKTLEEEGVPKNKLHYRVYS